MMIIVDLGVISRVHGPGWPSLWVSGSADISHSLVTVRFKTHSTWQWNKSQQHVVLILFGL